MIARINFFTFLFFIFGFLSYNPNSAAAFPVKQGEISRISDNYTNKASIFNHLQQEEVLEITIATDLDKIINSERDAKYTDAQLTYTNQEGQEMDWDIRLKARGKYRRRVCDFPPLKVDFDKKDLANENLLDFDKLKLVTHCLDDATISKENVLKEYLAYRLFNEVTDNSFRVQLVKITYVNMGNSGGKIKRYGFLIESEDELAARLNGEIYESFSVPDAELNAEQESLVSVFQYMIGNEDWDTKMMRNVKLIKPKNGGKTLVIPYDFDFAGLVNPSYALANKDYNLKSVKDRYFLGNKNKAFEIKKAVELMNDKKADFENIVNSTDLLRKYARKSTIAYLTSFYETDNLVGISKPVESSPTTNQSKIAK